MGAPSLGKAFILVGPLPVVVPISKISIISDEKREMNESHNYGNGDGCSSL